MLYCHAHGNRHDIGKSELVEGRPALQRPYADDLARLGLAALCIDLPCFGERSGISESRAAKAAHWQGRTLFGQMLLELRAALGILAAEAGTDEQAPAAVGLSMGATLAWWLGALDTRVSGVAELCCFSDLATLVERGAHDLHGPYMTVPGLLREFDTAAIAGLIAPRPHLACVGLADPLTPPDGVGIVDRALRARYATAGAPRAWRLIADAAGGHRETAAMREAVLAFLDDLCRRAAPRGGPGT